jgi:hypothetical protein
MLGEPRTAIRVEMVCGADWILRDRHRSATASAGLHCDPPPVEALPQETLAAGHKLQAKFYRWPATTPRLLRGTDPSVVGLVYVAAHMPDAGEKESDNGKRFSSDLAKSGGHKENARRFHICRPGAIS